MLDPRLEALFARGIDPHEAGGAGKAGEAGKAGRAGSQAGWPARDEVLAFAAPFVRRVRHRLPDHETRVVWSYFGLSVLFCAANQYSWLQPLTGFRYLVPIVPGLALLAMQAGQALPPKPKWALAIAACAQSLILAAGHENDIRRELSAVWERRFAFFWMVRLQEAGVTVTWVWPLIAYLILIAILMLTWRRALPDRYRL